MVKMRAQNMLIRLLGDERDQVLERNAPCGPVYCCAADFVLRHGKWYEDGPGVGTYEQGPPRQCFAWSLALGGMNGLRYIEGYALDPASRLAIPHAWNLDAAGCLIDATWMNMGLAYLGVEFSLERAADALWNGDSHVLNDYQRRWPLFRAPWLGEDFALSWPRIEILELWRKRDPVRLAKFLEFHGGSR